MQRRVVISAILIVGTAAAALMSRDDATRHVVLDASRDAAHAAGFAARRFADALERAYARAPLAVLAFGFGLILPIAGMAAWLLRFSAQVLARLLYRPAPVAHDARMAHPGSVGWLDVGRDNPRRLRLARDLHQIGHDADCDIRLDDAVAGTLHAVIRRTPEREYHLIDISGTAEPAIHLNGAGCRMATLRDGDTITGGGMHAIFRHAATWPTGAHSPVRTGPPDGFNGRA